MKIPQVTATLLSVLTVCLTVHALVSDISVDFGEDVTLPCDGSAQVATPHDAPYVVWEAMGKKVASYRGGTVTIGRGFESRAALEPEEMLLRGNFSLLLQKAVFTDTDLYECLWQGRQTIAVVTLKVRKPVYRSVSLFVEEGSSVTLPCYGEIPRTMPLNKLSVQWLKGRTEVLALHSGQLTSTDRTSTDRTSTWTLPAAEDISLGNLSMTIGKVQLSDRGTYHCVYKTYNNEAVEKGVPESIELSVKGEMTVLGTETSPEIKASETSTWDSTFSRVITSENIPVKGDVSSKVVSDAPADITTADAPQGAFTDAIVIPSPGPETSTHGGDLAWEEEVPWVRIGIIAGVVLVTVVVVCLLLALGII